MPQEGAKLEQLKILLVEDSPEDAELLSDQLLDAGIDALFERVDNEASLQAVLEQFQPDIVLSDLSMPGFSGYQALRMVRQRGATPFIFVSGTMGEETAVKALQDGANDYIIKHTPTRLPSAVLRAIREARAEIERQRVENELMRAQRLESLAMLAAGLSHDLRNILQPLLIVPDLLAGRSDDPQLRQLANVVAECGRRGHEMAESMLSFVRGSNKPREQVSIANLFQAVQMLLRSSLPDGVRLQMDLLASDLTIEANYTELQQCLLNLGLNAIQAMPDGGTLTLSADRHDERCVRMSVADTGVGMGDDTRARLFSPFFTTKVDGTGLGLISCKRIVESYGGSIQVDSQLGEGTRFDMIVPMRAPVSAASEAELPPALGHGQRILLVDGEATRLSLLGNALSSQGYQPQLATDGAAALQIVQQHAMPDLVIIDSEIILLSAVSVLLSMQELGYQGPAIVLEDVGTPLRRAYFPHDIPVHVLRKPLEMRRVFRAVAHALEAV
ncbi:ATP-binding response regulator [Xanthomonas maliensis]|uniref:ATP-binding response regulator n=2 Tax=Xanthomonas maliensis TaxID=1321368 RepID=UPI001263EA03|nr:hybrid sensor histidine kinase/response regulator [Xanthomonas maliensis]KAB7767838.1 hybrid sensor histidine kinase/response regulator [Xanthomonas maliensis]